MRLTIVLMLGLVLVGLGCVSTTPPANTTTGQTPGTTTSVNPNGGTPLPDYTPPVDNGTAAGTIPTGTDNGNVGAADQPTPDAGVTVDMANFQFNPSTITITAGQTIHFTNTDMMTHDLRVYNATTEVYPQSTIAPGQTIDVTIPSAGTYTMDCHRHLPNMTGTITVNP